jgi:hypothetical protein
MGKLNKATYIQKKIIKKKEENPKNKEKKNKRDNNTLLFVNQTHSVHMQQQ